MVFGNPLKFAVLIEHIPMWSANDQFKNGLFHYFINGHIFPDEVRVATLNVDVYDLLNNHAILFPAIDSDLYNMNKNDAYLLMLSSIYPSLAFPEVEVPEDFVESNKYQLSTDNLEESGCYVFAVSDGETIRVLASQLTVLKNDKDGCGYWERASELKVEEAFIPKSELHKNLIEIKNFI